MHCTPLTDEQLMRMMAGQTTAQRGESDRERAARELTEARFGGWIAACAAMRLSRAFERGAYLALGGFVYLPTTEAWSAEQIAAYKQGAAALPL